MCCRPDSTGKQLFSTRVLQRVLVPTSLQVCSHADAGKIEKIGGITCYVGTPTEECTRDGVLLCLTDAFGIDLINTQV